MNHGGCVYNAWLVNTGIFCDTSRVSVTGKMPRCRVAEKRGLYLVLVLLDRVVCARFGMLHEHVIPAMACIDP